MKKKQCKVQKEKVEIMKTKDLKSFRSRFDKKLQDSFAKNSESTALYVCHAGLYAIKIVLMWIFCSYK